MDYQDANNFAQAVDEFRRKQEPTEPKRQRRPPMRLIHVGSAMPTVLLFSTKSGNRKLQIGYPDEPGVVFSFEQPVHEATFMEALIREWSRQRATPTLIEYLKAWWEGRHV